MANQLAGGIAGAYGPGQTFDWSQSQTQAGDYNDPYNLYLSARPIMQQNQNQQIGSALANSGFGGNRYSSTAMNAAGNIGAQTSLQMNDMLTNLMYNQTNQDLQNQMSAANSYLSATPMVETALSNRYGAKSDALKAQMQAFEQQRAAAMANQRLQYENFQQNRYGTLPMLAQYLTNSTGSGGEPIVTSKGGSTGYGNDLLQALATYYGGK